MKDDIPSNHALTVLYSRMDEKLDSILENQKKAEIWQIAHGKDDKEVAENLHKRISTLRNYGAAIAIVAGAVGVCAGIGWEVFKKKILGI